MEPLRDRAQLPVSEIKKTEVTYLNRTIKVMTKKTEDPELGQKLTKILNEASSLDDGPFLKEFTKLVKRYETLVPEEQKKVVLSVRTLKNNIERDIRRGERGGTVEQAPSRAAVKRGREVMEEEEVPTAMQRASRGIVPAFIAPVALGIVQNAPFIFSIGNSEEAFAALASVALDVGSAALFTTPVIFGTAAVLPSSQKRGRVDQDQ